MMLTFLLNSLLLSVSTWYTLPEPPDSAAFAESFSEEPIEVLIFMARSGWTPDWIDPGVLSVTLFEQYPSDAAVIAWTASIMNVPLRTESIPVLMEYGDDYTIPDPESISENPQLLNAFLRRVQHIIIAGEEPDEPERIVEIITGSWSDLPLDCKALSLEVLGKLGIDITGDINLEEFGGGRSRGCCQIFK